MAEREILLETGTNELEILEFYINAGAPAMTEDQTQEQDRCILGVNVAKVLEVIENPGLDRPEHAPHPCFMGVLPLRGRVLPVLDLGVWLGLEREPHPHDVIIVTEFSQTVTGFIVSGVVDIHRVFWKDVEPPSGVLSRLDESSIVGLTRIDDHFVQLVDLEYIISEFDESARPSKDFESFEDDVRWKALVADDSKVIRGLMEEVMGRANFDYHVVTNGEDGLKYVMKMKQEAKDQGLEITDLLNVIVSDIEMPSMDGFTMTKHIKDDPVLSRLPVILYSSLITPELRHKGEAVKADEQVAKPDLGEVPSIARRLIAEYGHPRPETEGVAG